LFLSPLRLPVVGWVSPFMTEHHGTHVLVVGVSTRAIAVSAARAGYRVTAVDGFGDLDLRAVADVVTLNSTSGARFHPAQASKAGRRIRADLVLYTSNLENHPKSVERLAQGRCLLGNPASVLRKVRNPLTVASLLRRRGFATPATRGSSPSSGAGGKTWLIKPRKSGGGHGIASWSSGQPVPRGTYLQERIPGSPGSVIFAADGTRAVVLGLSRQLVGEARFGAGSYRYCGSLIGSQGSPVFSHQAELLATAISMAGVLTEEFGLVGLNGVDFMASQGIPYPIEINPRFSASMELLERMHGVSMFEIHRRACQGTLPSPLAGKSGYAGKAIVFAKSDVVLGSTAGWTARPAFADVPPSGQRVERGRPICTVFGRGTDRASCVRSLIRRARVVYGRSRARTRKAA
jgi:uncharacterized protein